MKRLGVCAALLVLVMVAAREAHAQEDAPVPSRFYFHEGVGLGVFMGHTSYTDGSQDLMPSPTVGIVTTAAARLNDHFAFGGQVNLDLLLAATVTEDRLLGHLVHTTPLGAAVNLGPSFTLLGRSFHVDVSPGIYFLVVPHDNTDGNGNTYGGLGPAIYAAAAYDFPINARISFGIEARVTVAAQFSPGDRTYEAGIDFGAVVLATLRRR